MFNEHRYRDHQADVARKPESRRRNDNMDKKDNEIAHLSIVTKTANAMDCGARWLKLTIRHRPVCQGIWYMPFCQNAR
jgi:hypothetical protein